MLQHHEAWQLPSLVQKHAGPFIGAGRALPMSLRPVAAD